VTQAFHADESFASSSSRARSPLDASACPSVWSEVRGLAYDCIATGVGASVVWHGNHGESVSRVYIGRESAETATTGPFQNCGGGHQMTLQSDRQPDDLRGALNKVSWSGVVTSVRPRIRMLRSFDQRSHSYLGYVLGVNGTIGSQSGDFSVAIGEAAYAKHGLAVGDVASGEGVRVPDGRLETADLYKVSKLRILEERRASGSSPPWHGVAPDLAVYRERGHRRLAARTFAAKCGSCYWAALMPVEIIIDHWNPDRKSHRTETFCYGRIRVCDSNAVELEEVAVSPAVFRPFEAEMMKPRSELAEPA
jgi:hypothetical protein